MLSGDRPTLTKAFHLLSRGSRRGMASITVNGNTVEGQNQSPNAGNSNFVLLQGHHVLTVDEKQELEEHGISIFEYVAENTYLCRYEPHDIECLRHLDFVQTINV
jgi:hypothetical protein